MNIRCEGEHMIVELEGEIDEYICKYLREKIDDAYENSKAKDIILDFKQVDFIDSSGIGLILGRYKKVKENGGKVYVVSPKEQVQKVFEISNLYNLIIPCKNIEDLLIK